MSRAVLTLVLALASASAAGIAWALFAAPDVLLELLPWLMTRLSTVSVPTPGI